MYMHTLRKSFFICNRYRILATVGLCIVVVFIIFNLSTGNETNVGTGCSALVERYRLGHMRVFSLIWRHSTAPLTSPV